MIDIHTIDIRSTRKKLFDCLYDDLSFDIAVKALRLQSTIILRLKQHEHTITAQILDDNRDFPL